MPATLPASPLDAVRVNGHTLSESIAFRTNLATCDMLATLTAYPPEFAWSPIKASAAGAYSLRDDRAV